MSFYINVHKHMRKKNINQPVGEGGGGKCSWIVLPHEICLKCDLKAGKVYFSLDSVTPRGDE